jgi:hypothetical protein
LKEKGDRRCSGPGAGAVQRTIRALSGVSKEVNVSNEVEAYLTAYNQADAKAEALKRAAASIERIARALRAGSMTAWAEALPSYPTASELQAELAGLYRAKDRLQVCWDAIPPEMQPRLPRPDRVGRPHTEVFFGEQ